MESPILLRAHALALVVIKYGLVCVCVNALNWLLANVVLVIVVFVFIVIFVFCR